MKTTITTTLIALLAACAIVTPKLTDPVFLCLMAAGIACLVLAFCAFRRQKIPSEPGTVLFAPGAKTPASPANELIRQCRLLEKGSRESTPIVQVHESAQPGEIIVVVQNVWFGISKSLCDFGPHVFEKARFIAIWHGKVKFFDEWGHYLMPARQ